GSALIRRVAVYPSMTGNWTIHQDEVGALFRYGCERLLTVLDLGDLIVGMGKRIADNPATIRLILDHQNALASLHVAPLRVPDQCYANRTFRAMSALGRRWTSERFFVGPLPP